MLNHEYSFPKDIDGNFLDLDDRVLIPCTIIKIFYHNSYANLVVETEFPMYPSDKKIEIGINSSQILKKKRKYQKRFINIGRN